MMVRNVKKALFIIMAMIMMTVFCRAEESYDSLYRQLGVEKLYQTVPEQAAEMVNDIGLSDLSIGGILSLEPRELWRMIREQLGQAALKYKRELFSVMAAVLLSALTTAFSDSGRISVVFSLICVLTVVSLLCRPVVSQMNDCCEAVRAVSGFMLGYIPVFASAAAASGAGMSAAAYQLPVMAAAQIMSQLANGFFLPLLQSYMLLVLGGAIGESSSLRHLSEPLKKLISWSLALAATMFSGILAVQSVFSRAADGVFTKTAKFLIGSFVPVIGGALAEAASAMQSSIIMIKAGLGGFGILVVTLSFLKPLCEVVALRIVIYSAQTAAKILSAGQIEAILAGFANVVSVMQALLLSVLSVLLISTAIMLSVGGGIVA